MKTKNNSKKLIMLGAVLITASIVFLLYIFYPAIKVELQYIFSDKGKNDVVALRSEDQEGEDLPASYPENNESDTIYPVDEDFGIIIPKIGANSKVIANVDPYNSEEYQQKLSEGVAHAKGTVFPNQVGNIFMFAHSSVDFYEANRWNSIFYLLHRLEIGDEVYLSFEKKLYKYKIIESVKVPRDDLSFLRDTTDKKILTLMTCWPPGTDWERLIVRAELVPE